MPTSALRRSMPRFATRILALTAALVVVAVTACSSNYSGEGQEFTFKANIASVDITPDAYGNQSTSVTLSNIRDAEGPGASWFSDAHNRSVYNDYYDGDLRHQTPGHAYNANGAEIPATDLREGQPVTVRGKLRTDAHRDVKELVKADRPVFDRIEVMK